MSSINLETKLALKIEKEISKHLDAIIPDLRQLAKDFSIAQKDKKSPFRNVLSVATEAGSSIEVIKTYIRYQIGRKESSPIWKTKVNEKYFANAVVEKIDSLLENAQKIIDEIKNSQESSLAEYLVDTTLEKNKVKDIHMLLTQLFLGYLAREHTAMIGESK